MNSPECDPGEDTGEDEKNLGGTMSAGMALLRHGFKKHLPDLAN